MASGAGVGVGWSDGEDHDFESKALYEYWRRVYAQATEPYRLAALQQERVINLWLRDLTSNLLFSLSHMDRNPQPPNSIERVLCLLPVGFYRRLGR